MRVYLWRLECTGDQLITFTAVYCFPAVQPVHLFKWGLSYWWVNPCSSSHRKISFSLQTTWGRELTWRNWDMWSLVEEYIEEYRLLSLVGKCVLVEGGSGTPVTTFEPSGGVGLIQRNADEVWCLLENASGVLTKAALSLFYGWAVMLLCLAVVSYRLLMLYCKVHSCTYLKTKLLTMCHSGYRQTR